MAYDNKNEQVLLHLDSSQLSTGTNEDFTIILNPSIKRVRSVELISAEIPFSFYIITSSNNSLQFNDGSTTYTINVPVGNYDGTTFAATLKTLMNAVSSSFDVVYSLSTYKIQFTRSAGNFQIFYATSTIAMVIGLTANSTVTNNFICQKISNLSGPNYLLINSLALTRPKVTRSYNGTSQSNILYKCPIDVNPGSIIIQKNTKSEILKFALPQTISDIDLSLKFPDNSIVNLNGQTWSISLLLEKD